MERHALAKFEGVLRTAFGGFGNRTFTKIAFEVRRIGRIIRIHADDQAVERPDRVNHTESRFLVPIERRDVGTDHEVQNTTRLGRLSLRCTRTCSKAEAYRSSESESPS